MKEIDFKRFLQRLSSVSERSLIDPHSFDWPAEADPDAWYFSPELISLYGTPAWNALDVARRKKLSLCEAVNFFSLNIHGEKYLISEISRRQYSGDAPELSRYLTHFVAEETRHMQYFSGFCRRYGSRVHADRAVHSGDSVDAELDLFLLFARINVFEEIVDHYNRTMAKDERLAPVAREINRIHHVEELRHLAFGRRFLSRCVEQHIDDWDEERRAMLRDHLSNYLRFVWKQYYNPDAYRDAGIDDAFDVWRGVRNAPCARRHRESINHERLGFLRKLQLLEVS